jgi:hypothetical protein
MEALKIGSLVKFMADNEIWIVTSIQPNRNRVFLKPYCEAAKKANTRFNITFDIFLLEKQVTIID